MINQDEKLFHAYITDSLSEAEKAQLENDMLHDPIRNEAFHEYQTKYFLAEKLIAADLKAKCKASINRHELKKKVSKISLVLRGLVASILVVLGAFLWHSNVKRIKSAEKSDFSNTFPPASSENTYVDSNQLVSMKGTATSIPEIDIETPQVAEPKQTSKIAKTEINNTKKEIANNTPETPAKSQAKPKHREAKIFAIATQKTYQPEITTTREDSPNHISQALNKAKEQYLQKNYEETFRLLREVPASQNPQASYLRGHTFFATGAYQEAFLEFQNAAQSMMHKKDAQWYALLSLIAGGQHNLEALDTILSDKKHPYLKEAQAIELKLGDE